MRAGADAPDSGRVKESAPWSYDEAFCRNLGLISPTEQQRLRNSRVAIAGMGGVGGIDMVALARMGIGKFTIADPDVFEIRNSNRQYGAMRSTNGQAKAEVMRNIVHDINPEAEIRAFCEPIGKENAATFLEGADVLVDGIDAFEIDLRRLLYREAQQRGIYALGAGPLGFSTAWVVFDPKGMTFDRYFDLSDAMNTVDKFVAFIAGIAPSATHRRSIDLSYVDIENRTGPSVARLSSGFRCGGGRGVEDSARTWARLRCSLLSSVRCLPQHLCSEAFTVRKSPPSTESQAAIAGPLHKSTIGGGNTGTAVSQDGTELLVGSCT